MPETLNYSLLDDLLLAFSIGRKKAAAEALSSCKVSTIGPILEYTFHQQASDELPSLIDVPNSCVTQSLLDTQSGRTTSPLSLTANRFEFSRSPLVPSSFNDPRWISFCKRLEAAARLGGFDRRSAAGFTGAFVEMVDNVVQHSERPQSAIVGYRWEENEFEYVVADAGIGVLASLTKCPTYGALTDHGAAIQTALSLGESRFGAGTGHGNGFRNVFVSLANYLGSLRFRSGDQALEIDGSSPSLMNHRLTQRTNYKGFMVSVVCRR